MATVSQNIVIAPGDLSRKDTVRLKQWLTFQPDASTVKWVYKETPEGLIVPRGAWDLLPADLPMRDRRSFPKLPRHDTGIVLDYADESKSFVGQRQCVEAMLNPANHQQGFIHRQPGSGKSNIACFFIANVGTRTLVIVHTEDLLNQWLMYAEKVIPTMEVGVVRGKREDISQLTLATVQTLFRRNYGDDFYRQFGATILDECLHAPANTFDEVLSRCASRYRFGLSASSFRADNTQDIVRYLIGSTIHELDFSSAVPVAVRKVRSGFRHRNLRGNMYQRRNGYAQLLDALTTSPKRNRIIAKHANRQLAKGRSVLILSRRIEQLELIQELIDSDSEILAAKLLKKSEREEILVRFKAGTLKCVLATQLADEGLDVPILSCVILTYPAKYTDLILQQAGRALRQYQGKDSAEIIDIVDDRIGILNSQWHHRRRAYRKWGFRITGNGLADRVVMPLALRDPKAARNRRRMLKATVYSRAHPDQEIAIPAD